MRLRRNVLRSNPDLKSQVSHLDAPADTMSVAADAEFCSARSIVDEVSIDVVQKVFGHPSLQTTTIYVLGEKARRRRSGALPCGGDAQNALVEEAKGKCCGTSDKSGRWANPRASLTANHLILTSCRRLQIVDRD